MKSKEVMKKFKEQICPFCIHNKDIDYQDCKIVIQIDGEADCTNYKCNEYCKKVKQNTKNREKIYE